jgi:hypothetical protein
MRYDYDEIEVTNTPLTSGEQGKVFVFALLMLPTLLAIVGILPAIFLIFGVVLLKKNKDFSAIETSVKLMRGYLWVGLLIAGGFTIYWASTYGTDAATYKYGDGGWMNEAAFYASATISVILIVYMILVNALYLSPLRNHKDWVEINGIFSSSTAESNQPMKGNDIKIIKGENLSSYSVADELIKWAQLKEDGHISEIEFNEARAKLLKKS